jgi:hypothetical protein
LKPLADTIFSIKKPAIFEELAMAVFRYQASANEVYKQYVTTLEIEPGSVDNSAQIPFLPIEFFKSRQIISGEPPTAQTQVFTSSGTTQSIQSRHYIPELAMYEKSYRKGFELFYGSPEDYCILALLPSYMEREGSSLIYMMEDLIKRTKHSDSGFYLENHADLIARLQKLEASGQKTILIGVTYALLDLLEKQKFQLKNTIIMETGGMKGKRQEMIREELHATLCEGFGVNAIHSEYGMTELLSQAYSKGNGIFNCPPWMKIIIRDVNDPFAILPPNRTGGINVIDLANLNSCSFIATQDLGKTHPDGSFEVLGRFDNSDIRGCNLLVQ